MTSPFDVYAPLDAYASVHDDIVIYYGSMFLSGIDIRNVEWWTKIDSGWGGVASSISPQQRARAAGAWGGPRQYAARTISLSGTLLAPSVAEARDAFERLNNAIDLDPVKLQVWEHNDLKRWVMAERHDEILNTWINDRTISWSTGVIARDAFRFADPIVGTCVVNFANYPGGVIPSDAYTVMNNPGNVGGPMQVRIPGPVTAPRILDQKTGRVVSFPGLSLSSSQQLDVDLRSYVQSAVITTVAPLGGATSTANANSYISDRQWFDFNPGFQGYLVTGSANGGAAPTAVFTATPAWR